MIFAFDLDATYKQISAAFTTKKFKLVHLLFECEMSQCM